MKKNIIKKLVTGSVLATLLFASSCLTAFASPMDTASGTVLNVMSKSNDDGFFISKDSEGYCYQVGDEVEVKISRGYYTVRCRITDRKTDWFNGNMYYVQPIEELNFLQDLFFSAGWVHESDIQTINPQPYFKMIFEVIKKFI